MPEIRRQTFEHVGSETSFAALAKGSNNIPTHKETSGRRRRKSRREGQAGLASKRLTLQEQVAQHVRQEERR